MSDYKKNHNGVLSNTNNGANNEENKSTAQTSSPSIRPSNATSAPMGEPLNESARAQRPKRIPLSKQRKLDAPLRPGFKRRFVNDREDNIERRKLAGYSIVEGDFKTSEQSKDPTHLGSQVRRSVGRGTQAVLMEIPEEWWAEDYHEQVKKNVDDLKQMIKPKDQNSYGEVLIKESRYSE